MSNEETNQLIAEIAVFKPSVQRCLHAWVKVAGAAGDALVCVWSDAAGRSHKQAFEVPAEQDATLVARSLNKETGVNEAVVTLQLDLYRSRTGESVGEQIAY